MLYSALFFFLAGLCHTFIVLCISIFSPPVWTEEESWIPLELLRGFPTSVRKPGF